MKNLAQSLCLLLPAVAMVGDAITGPNSSREPYMVPLAENVTTVALLSGGDYAAGNLRLPSLAGIADGAGVLGTEDGKLRFFVQHELSNGDGVARAHGGVGAFISEWIVDPTTYEVIDGEDLVKQVHLYDPSSCSFYLAEKEALNRLCSADLPGPGAFLYKKNKGTEESLFLGGEENDAFFGGAYGRAFATVVTGNEKGAMYELPYLGDFAWENAVASPYAQKKTIVAGLDDSVSNDLDTLGELYFYVGDKANQGHPIEKSGLHGGVLYALAVSGWDAQENGTTGSVEPLALDVGDSFRFEMVAPLTPEQVRGDDGTALFAATVFGNPSGITKFARPEDGAWDPTNVNSFYFATTGRLGRPTRIWEVEFRNIEKPERGGTITLVLDGTNSSDDLSNVYTADNLCVDSNGDIFIQEDPGSSSRFARLWRFSPGTQTLVALAEANPLYFSADYSGGISDDITTNEESSGIIEIGSGWYFMSMQSHINLEGSATSRERFGYTEEQGLRYDEDAQLLLMHVEQ